LERNDFNMQCVYVIITTPTMWADFKVRYDAMDCAHYATTNVPSAAYLYWRDYMLYNHRVYVDPGKDRWY